jgi:hypothetical protein
MEQEDPKLKDAILSTLAEMQRDEFQESRDSGRGNINLSITQNSPTPEEIQSIRTDHKVEKDLFFQKNGFGAEKKVTESEIEYLTSVRQRVLVLFEGLKSEESDHLEAKLNLTLSFMETLIQSIDDRIKGA